MNINNIVLYIQKKLDKFDDYLDEKINEIFFIEVRHQSTQTPFNSCCVHLCCPINCFNSLFKNRSDYEVVNNPVVNRKIENNEVVNNVIIDINSIENIEQIESNINEEHLDNVESKINDEHLEQIESNINEEHLENIESKISDEQIEQIETTENKVNELEIKFESNKDTTKLLNKPLQYGTSTENNNLFLNEDQYDNISDISSDNSDYDIIDNLSDEYDKKEN